MQCASHRDIQYMWHHQRAAKSIYPSIIVPAPYVTRGLLVFISSVYGAKAANTPCLRSYAHTTGQFEVSNWPKYAFFFQEPSERSTNSTQKDTWSDIEPGLTSFCPVTELTTKIPYRLSQNLGADKSLIHVPLQKLFESSLSLNFQEVMNVKHDVVTHEVN